MLVEVFRALQDDRRPTTDDQVGAGSSVVDRWSLVIAGSGPLQEELARELGALGVPVRFLDWVDHDEVLRLMAHCTLLLFPSAWGDPLSRVLLEAAACGAPILAMPTGGTGNIIIDGVSGALEPTPHQFARRLATLLADPAQRQSLADGARRLARERFSTSLLERR
jgi:glycosyltransferase involved in cell wall biosynthesis